ncbi:MAG TPA: SDR family NAD(P)-dependent oxidoreductase [Gemmatimonadota bacterium]|nr:SDR family NAD(P)-dependent oxidoreductase [Gemmatimonadota bacterium]
MDRIEERTVLVTGASAGIGRACARRFAASGAGLVLWARRLDRLEELADELRSAQGAEVRVAEVDVRDREAVGRQASRLAEEGVVPDILVNNAGLASGLDPIQAGDPEDWDRMIDTNVKGLLNVSRAFLPRMIEAGRGHVINLGSTAGHQVYPRGNVYNASKFAVKALTEGMNVDLSGTPVRVSSVDPGFVHTEFSKVRFHGNEERAEAVYDGFHPLTAEDVADTIHYVASAPDHVNVFQVILLPAAQRNVYVLDRRES